MELKAVIFDLDGVIVDTVDLHFRAWQKMFSEYGKEFSFQDYKEKVDGVSRIEGARAILPELSDEELEAASTRKQAYFLELVDKEGVKVYPSSVELLRQLISEGCKTELISASRNCYYILRKAGIEELFEVIVGGGEVERGKPAPDIFIVVSQRLKVKPQEAIVIEDALLGVEAAKKANFFVVGVDRYNQPRRLEKADLVVKDLSELNYSRLKEVFRNAQK